MTVEEQLAQALRTIADRAEDRDVLAGVTAKRRRRARRRAAGAFAGACVTVLAAWGVLVVRPAPPLVARPAPQTVVDAARPEANPVERVWPEAVFTMPAGSRPRAAISATEVLVWAERGALEVYDAGSGRSRAVASLATAPEVLAVDRERVVWLADGYAWVASLRTGGRERKVGPVAGEAVDRVALAGRYVVWSSPLGGVWRMGIDGGAPERVAAGLQLVEWPWATDEPLDTRTNPTELVDLPTGRTISIRPATGVEGLRCGPTWCAGTRGSSVVVQRSDGGGSGVHRTLRGYPYRDRFFTGAGEIYDAATGTTVTFEGERAGGGMSWSTGDGVVFWAQGDGVRVVNLAAVTQR